MPGSRRSQAACSASGWRCADGDRFELIVRVFRTYDGKGGDLDNYVKAVSDAINGIAFPDDRYVRSLTASLHQDREEPRVEVEVRRLDMAERRTG